MTPRSGSSYVLRAVLVNALLLVGVFQLWRNGHLTGSLIALYIGFFLVANILIYAGSRFRTRMQNR